ncbi:MAG: TOBE domain-containing protein, partial [Rhodobacterales bacterium]
DFIGSANIFEGRVIEDGVDFVRVETDIAEVFINHGEPILVGSKIWVALRPEKIRITKTEDRFSGPNQVSGLVDDIGYLGETSIYKVQLPNGQIFDVTAPNNARPMDRKHSITWDEKVNISWEPSSVMLLTS